MIKELHLQIIQIKKETHDVKTLILGLGNEGFEYKPGQFITLTLAINDPEGNIRAFSLASSSTEKGLIMISTKLTGTPYKKKLDSLDVGNTVKIKGPFGNFVLIESAIEIVMLGGGIGITPFRNMIKYATDKKLPIKITLLYSNKTPIDIVYRGEWPLIERQNPNFRIVNTITNLEGSNQAWQGRTGRIDENMIREYVNNINIPIYYICGPPAMVDAMANLLNGMNVPKNNIKIERFVGY